MTKIIVDKEQLEKLLEVVSSCSGDCPAEKFNEKITWCSEEFCINCDEYDCIKKWLGVEKLPPRRMYETIVFADGKEYLRTNAIGEYEKGWNDCLDEIEGEKYVTI